MSLPVVVVATLTVKPESVDTVRGILHRTVAAVHDEPGCQLYALHEADGAFVFVEQWAGSDALTAHTAAPAFTTMLADVGDHLTAAPDVKLLAPSSAGAPDKGRLRP